jgi:hypothetical protein
VEAKSPATKQGSASKSRAKNTGTATGARGKKRAAATTEDEASSQKDDDEQILKESKKEPKKELKKEPGDREQATKKIKKIKTEVDDEFAKA